MARPCPRPPLPPRCPFIVCDVTTASRSGRIASPTVRVRSQTDRSTVRRKVVHLTTVHRPTDVRIFQREAATLAANGYEVTLVACADASYDDRGVRVRAIPRPRSRISRMTLTAGRAFRAALRERADLYHFHDPELIPIALLLTAAGKRVVYDVHEDAAKDVFDKPYLPSWLKPLVHVIVARVERAAAVRFDAIIAATSAIARKFPAERTVLLRNVPVMNELMTPDARPFASRSRNVAYLGGLAPFNGPEQMIRAMAALPDSAGIRLVLGGRAPTTEYEATLRAMPGHERVEFVGWVDRSRMAEVFADARAGLVVYQPTPNIMDCEPNKFFEVMSAGLPLIASNLPHWQAFIAAHDCGVVVSPDDPAAIARAIQELVDDPVRSEAMGRRGRALVEHEYNWEAESGKLLALYARLLVDAPVVHTRSTAAAV